MEEEKKTQEAEETKTAKDLDFYKSYYDRYYRLRVRMDVAMEVADSMAVLNSDKLTTIKTLLQIY